MHAWSILSRSRTDVTWPLWHKNAATTSLCAGSSRRALSGFWRSERGSAVLKLPSYGFRNVFQKNELHDERSAGPVMARKSLGPSSGISSRSGMMKTDYTMKRIKSSPCQRLTGESRIRPAANCKRWNPQLSRDSKSTAEEVTRWIRRGARADPSNATPRLEVTDHRIGTWSRGVGLPMRHITWRICKSVEIFPEGVWKGH